MDHTDLAGLRVLVVEDEMLVVLVIEELLADEHCVVVGPFARITEALAAARCEAIDVALLDVNVAGVRAYPVAEALVERGIPFLFLSGYGQSAVPRDRPDWRVCAKPFRATDLVTMLVERVASARANGPG